MTEAGQVELARRIESWKTFARAMNSLPKQNQRLSAKASVADTCLEGAASRRWERRHALTFSVK